MGSPIIPTRENSITILLCGTAGLPQTQDFHSQLDSHQAQGASFPVLLPPLPCGTSQLLKPPLQQGSPCYFWEKREALTWELSFPASKCPSPAPKPASALPDWYNGGGAPSSLWNVLEAPNAIPLPFLAHQPPRLLGASFDIPKDFNLPQLKRGKQQAACWPPAAAFSLSPSEPLEWGPVLCPSSPFLISRHGSIHTKAAVAELLLPRPGSSWSLPSKDIASLSKRARFCT